MHSCLPQSTEDVNSQGQEIRERQDSMAELGPAGQTKGKKANSQEVEASTGDLRRV